MEWLIQTFWPSWKIHFNPFLRSQSLFSRFHQVLFHWQIFILSSESSIVKAVGESNFIKEWMPYKKSCKYLIVSLQNMLPEDLIETNSLSRFIDEHGADQIKQVLVIISLTLLVILNSDQWMTSEWYIVVMVTLIALQFSLTYFPAEECSSHKRRPPWKYLVLVLLTILQTSSIIRPGRT